MKRPMILSSNKGFSLIELMVVVAIIAILASFAIPQYQNFQSKARQKEGLTLLNSYFVAARATEAESGLHHGNFVAIGFNPTGQLHYRVTTANGAAVVTGPTDVACIVTSAACNGSGFVRAWTEVAAGAFAVAAPAGGCAGAYAAGPPITWTTCASAIIRSGGTAADADTWSINQAKVLTNMNDGIN